MKHPGTVTFIDEAEGTVRDVAFDSLPETIAFVQSPDGSVPVVTVKSHLRGDQRIIRRYGPGDVLLDTIVQAPQPGRPS